MTVTVVVCTCGHPRTRHLAVPDVPFRTGRCQVCGCGRYTLDHTSLPVRRDGPSRQDPGPHPG